MRILVLVVLLLLMAGLVAWFAQAAGPNPSAPSPFEAATSPDHASVEAARAKAPATEGFDPANAERGAVEESAQEPSVEQAEPRSVGNDVLGATLEVRVLYLASKGADTVASDVPVYIQSLSELSRAGTWRSRRSRRTDEAGIAQFEHLAAGFVRVTTAFGGERSLTLEHGEENKITVRVPPGFVVRGVVVDPSGAPIEQAAVWVSDAWEERRGEILAVTDVVGAFTLSRLKGHRHLSVSADGFLPSNLRPLQAVPGDDIEVRFVLQHGTAGTVRGRVLDHQLKPVADARVLVGEDLRTGGRVRAADGTWVAGPPPRATRSKADGSFEVRGVAPQASVKVQARADGFAAAVAVVDVLAGTPTVVPDLLLGPPASLHGTVQNADGTHASSVLVTLGEAGFAGGRVRTDEAGKYRFDGLAPGGEVELRAVTRSARAYAKVLLVDAVLYRVDLELVATSDAAASTKLVRGRIVNSAGEAQSGWRVVITASDAVSGPREHGLTNREGRFELRSAYARVALHANPPGAWAGLPPLFVPSLSADGVEHELRVPDPLTETGEIRGRILDPFGQPHEASIEVWHEELRLYAKTRASATTGEFLFENVWPGPYRIDVHSAELPWLNLGAREVGRGQVVDLGNLTLQSGGAITGSLRLRGGGLPPAAGLEMVIIKGARQVGVVDYAEGVFRSNQIAVASDYMLVIRGPRIVQRSIAGISVRSGDTTRLDVELESAAERVLRFVLPLGRESPTPFSVLIRAADSSQLVWNGSPSPDARLEVRVAVPPGSYVVQVFASDNQQLGEWPLQVADVRDVEPIVYELD